MAAFDRDSLLAQLRLLRPRFERSGVRHVALFGSRSRQDNRPDSDVDLMIDVESNDNFSLFDLIGINHIVEDELGLPASIIMRRSLTPEFERATRNDVIEVF